MTDPVDPDDYDPDDYSLDTRREFWGWFGEPWPSGICNKMDSEGRDVIPHEWDWSMRVPTPVGTACIWCHEKIVEGDRGQMIPHFPLGERPEVNAHHRECALYNVMGPNGSFDLSGMTEREKAIAVWDSWVR